MYEGASSKELWLFRARSVAQTRVLKENYLWRQVPRNVMRPNTFSSLFVRNYHKFRSSDIEITKNKGG